jgi:hypothetical protein
MNENMKTNNKNETVRLFGFIGDREIVKDFPSIEAAVEFAKEKGCEVNGILNETGLKKIKATRKAETEEWSRFAAASFEYVRGIRS